MTTVTDTVNVEESKENTLPSATPCRRRSTRRSVTTTTGKATNSKEEADLSSAENQYETATNSSGSVSEKTPSRKRRRSTRKSLAIAGTPRLSDIPEPVAETEQDGYKDEETAPLTKETSVDVSFK